MTITHQWVTGGRPESRNASGADSAPTGTHGISVQKYGGSSLATIAQVRQVARMVADTRRSGRPTVVVVSARGQTTDELLRLADALGRERTERETDQLLATGESASAALLAIALQDLGVPAVSLTGAQTGIRVAGKYGAGVIADIDTRRVRQILADGEVAVVAGFQGIGDTGDVVTLGRGGSDTTAVALTAALRAGSCEICTDVPGVATADPRVVTNARYLPAVDVGVMAEMSYSGAKVLHSRAVDLAAINRVELHIRSSKENSQTEPRTIIPAGHDGAILETREVVVAVTHDLEVARVLLHCESHRTDLAANILTMLSAQAVPVDLVARSDPQEDRLHMGFTIPRNDIAEALPTIREALAGLGSTVQVDENAGKVSLIGMGLLNRPEYTGRMLSALARADIPTNWLTTSQIRTSVVIPLDRVVAAVQLLHDEFELDRDPVSATST